VKHLSYFNFPVETFPFSDLHSSLARSVGDRQKRSRKERKVSRYHSSSEQRVLRLLFPSNILRQQFILYLILFSPSRSVQGGVLNANTKLMGLKLNNFCGFLHRRNHTQQPSIASAFGFVAVSESKSLSKTDFLPESSREDIMQAFLVFPPSPRPSLSGINSCIKIHH
jgi:hypothetical protein